MDETRERLIDTFPHQLLNLVAAMLFYPAFFTEMPVHGLDLLRKCDLDTDDLL